MTAKRGISFVFFICIFLFLISNIDALSLSGVKVADKLDFEPFLEKTYSFRAGVDSTHPMMYGVYAKGDLADYVTTSLSGAYMEAQGGFDFTATIKLPESLPSGMQTTYICVLEGEPKGGGNIGVLMEVCAVIYVKVLFQGKYLVIKNFDVSVANKQVQFILGVENWGTEKIESAKPFIDIFENNRTGKIVTVEGDGQPVESNGGATLTAYLDATTMSVGDYIANATVVYDGQKANASKQFKIGEMTLRITGFTSEFEQNKISPMDIMLESIWNQQIKNVYVEANITTLDEMRVINFITTPSGTIAPWGVLSLRGFFDTNGVEAGNYTAKFRIIYADKASEQQGTLTVKSKEEAAKAIIPVNSILLILILVLLIILVILIIKRKKKKE